MAKIHSLNLASNIHEHHNCDALQLKGRPTRCELFWAVCRQIHTAQAPYCYFPASDQNCDSAIRFSDHDFLKESNNLAIGQHFHTATLTFETWP